MATLLTLLSQLQVRALDLVGVPISGAKLNAYATGTTTRINTYSDAAGTTPNANPLTADSAGIFGPIYVQNVGYKWDMTTAAGVSLDGYPIDQWYPPGFVAMNAVSGAIASTVQGRLTLTSGTPVTTADVTGATSVFWTPYKGNGIGLYDGTTWTLVNTPEKSLSLAGLAANLPQDIWGRSVAGVLTLDNTAWTNTTTRATALTTQDGVLVKSGDATRRYLGTICTTAVVGQTEDSFAKRLVWNYANRVPRVLRVLETTDSWTYTTATYRQANGSTANQVAVVVGVAETPVELVARGIATNSTANVTATTGIGEDLTTTPVAGCLLSSMSTSVNAFMTPVAELRKYPTVGFHFYAWLETSVASGTATWYGDGGGVILQSGLHGTIQG